MRFKGGNGELDLLANLELQSSEPLFTDPRKLKPTSDEDVVFLRVLTHAFGIGKSGL